MFYTAALLFLSLLLLDDVRAGGLGIKGHGQSMRRHSSLVQHRKRGPVTSFNNAPGTHYDVTTAESDCGDWPKPSDFVVAMNSLDLDNNKQCHQPITITYKGKTTVAKIVDECPTCWPGGIDMSDGLFEFFAPLPVGLIYVDWFIGEPAAQPAAKPPPPPSTTHHTTTTTTTTTHHTTSTSSHSPSPSSNQAPAAIVAQPLKGNIQAVMQAMVGMGELVAVSAKNSTKSSSA